MVHSARCPLVGTPGKGKDCSELCGLRLSASRVHVMVNALRAFFNVMHGRAPHSPGPPPTGNPVVSDPVLKFEALVKKEQLAAEVVVKQARPTFLFELRTVMSAIDNRIQFGGLTTHETWDAMADQCFLLATFFCTDRSFDLARCKGRNLLKISDRSMVLNHTEGKVIRHMPRVATLLGHSDPVLDPVSRFNMLQHHAVCLSITDLTDVLLFRWFRGGTSLSASPVTTKLTNAMVAMWFTAACIFDGHTIHGLRTGAGIEIALRGGTVLEVADYVGWTEDTARHYLRLVDILHLCNSKSVFENFYSRNVSADDYLRLNKMLASRHAQ